MILDGKIEIAQYSGGESDIERKRLERSDGRRCRRSSINSVNCLLSESQTNIQYPEDKVI